MNLPRSYTPATEAEKKEIARLIALVAKSSPLQLLLMKSTLKEIYTGLDALHPLQFLRVIIEDKTLLEAMKKIKHNSMIWNEVIKQCTTYLSQEHALNNVLPHLPDNLSPLVEQEDWKQFIEQQIFTGLAV